MLLREYFRTEAAEQVASLERAASAGPEAWRPADVNRTARTLRGIARLAGDESLAAAAAAIEQATRTSEADEAGGVADRLRESVPELRILIDAGADAESRESKLQALIERLRPGSAADQTPAPGAGGEDEDSAFRAYVAREATAIADTMDRAIASFADTPSNREWLGAILRRQRPLLGAARLEDVAMVAEALRAVDELAELIVRLDVPVKSEWLDVFRTAREVLRASATSLEQGAAPPMTPALSRLRTLREELTDRYGERALSVDARTGSVAAGTTNRPARPAGSPARQRAAALHAEIATALAGQTRAREALDELYGLVAEGGA